MQTSKIKTVVHTGNKEWNGKVLKKYLVVFEDDQNGTLTVFPDGKEPAIGDEMTFEILDNGYGAEIKPQKTGGGGGFKPKQWTPEQVAQQDAVKITCSAIESGLKLSDYKQFFIECKDFMVQMTKGNTPEPETVKETGTTDDLPF